MCVILVSQHACVCVWDPPFCERFLASGWRFWWWRTWLSLGKAGSGPGKTYGPFLDWLDVPRSVQKGGSEEERDHVTLQGN